MDVLDTDEVGNRRIKIVKRRLKKVIMPVEAFVVFASAGHGAEKRIGNLGKRKGGVGKCRLKTPLCFIRKSFFGQKTSLYFLFAGNFKERAVFCRTLCFFFLLLFLAVRIAAIW